MPRSTGGLSRWTAGVLATIIFFMSSVVAFAQITVSKSILEFSANNLIEDVDIVNSASHKIFLKMSVAQIMNPETATPERVELTDPRTAAVLVSPTQLVVLPGERKRIRIILRKPPVQKDDIYRLAVKPFIGEVDMSANEGKKASALKVLLGYDLLLLARPVDATARLNVIRTDTRITFENTGNTNLLLRKMLQCNAEGEDCEELRPNRLYAGEVHQIDLPLQGSATRFPVQIWYSTGVDSQKEVH